MDFLLAAPRDPLLFLYPRFYTSTVTEAPREIIHEDNASETSSLTIKKYFQRRSQTKERCLDAPKKRAPIERHEHSTIVPVRTVPSRRRWPIDMGLSVPVRIANHKPCSLQLHRLRDTLRIEDAPNPRRVLTVAKGRQKHKADKASVNSRLKDKGLWSYDWRIPLGLLQQHYHCDNSEPEKENKRLVRGAMSKQQRTEDRPRFSEIHANRIPRPVVWSPLTFYNYVEDLTSSSVNRVMHHNLYKSHESHVAAIARILRELFDDPALQDCLTVKAFGSACVFLHKHGFVPITRALFIRMEQVGLSFNAETFNIILRGAASQKDLHNYTFFLRVMVRRGVKPNAGTWIALLMAIHSKAVKLLILKTMRERGLLDQTSNFKDAVNQIVEGEVVPHLDSGQDVTALLDLMDRKYGPNWFSVSAGNRILNDLGQRGLFLQAVDLLGFMEQRGSIPNAVTLNTLLGHCSRQGNVEGAIQMLRIFESSFNVFPEQNDFHALFMLVWKSQVLNCCRVVWAYACMAAAVSYYQQNLVMDSLARPIPSQQKKSMAEAWRNTAGKVIVGVRHGDGDGNDALRLSNIRQLVDLAETVTQPCEVPEFVKLLKQLLTQDLSAAKQSHPHLGLADKLEEALGMDRRWAREGIWKDSSTMWKVENAINVGVAPSVALKHFPSP